MYPEKRKIPQIHAPINSILLKVKILPLTNSNVDKNAIKKRYALKVNGGASCRASSVITNVATHTSVVKTKPSLASKILFEKILILYSSVNCCNS